jgi:CubicO group peptidase (beta-lactamase class C family)
MTDWPRQTGTFSLGDLACEKGGVIRDARIVWSAHGTLSPARDNVVLYPTSYGAQHPDLEWLIGPEGILDPTRWFIVIPNMFSNGLSSGAADTPDYPAIAGQDLRGFGWDIDTAHSRPRGMVFPVGSFGHTGFTGVTLWLDPGSDTYVVVLANVIHQRGGPPIAPLSGEIATATARALHLYGS